MTRTDYWLECLANAADEAGLVLSDDQLAALTSAVESGHENYGQAFYSPPAGEHLVAENARLKRDLSVERRKVGCPRCRGSGHITESFGPIGRVTTTPCDKCGGEGKITEGT